MPAEDDSKPAARDNPDAVDRERPDDPRTRIMITDQRYRRGIHRCLPRADAAPGKKHRKDAGRQPAKRGGERPYGNAAREDRVAREAINRSPERYSHDCVKERESESRQQPRLRVGQSQVGLDRIDQEAENEPVRISDDRHQHHQPDQITGIEGRLLFLHRCHA